MFHRKVWIFHGFLGVLFQLICLKSGLRCFDSFSCSYSALFLLFLIKTSLQFELSKLEIIFILCLMNPGLSRWSLICWSSAGSGTCFGNQCNQNKFLEVLAVFLSKNIPRFFIKTNIQFWSGNLQITFALDDPQWKQTKIDMLVW